MAGADAAAVDVLDGRRHVQIALQPDSSVLISFNGLAVLLLGMFPGNLMSVCAASVQQSLLLH